MTTPKRLFEVTVRMPAGHMSSRRIWLVVADREEEARSIVPDQSGIEAVHVAPEALSATGPSRIIGWTTGQEI